MKKMRLPLLIALAVAIIGIVFGSFFDLQISKAIASPTNKFALTVSAIMPTIGFAVVAAMGGGFIALIIKGKYSTALKVLFAVLAAACFGVSIFYPGAEYFGVNGFYWAAPKWVGYLIVIIPEALAAFGGYHLFKDNKNENLWIVFCAVVVLLVVALLVTITPLKSIMRRPRYRLISAVDDVSFHNWWEPFKEYKDYISAHPDVPHDNFKSFPSGHTAETSILLVGATFFPLTNEKYEKYQLPCFICACGCVLLVALARIMAAAHFLSDVSMGATIVIVLLFITNEIISHIKAVQLKKE